MTEFNQKVHDILIHQDFDESVAAEELNCDEDDVVQATLDLKISRCGACSCWHYEDDMEENACDLFCEHCADENTPDVEED